MHYTILKRFTKQEALSFIYLFIFDDYSAVVSEAKYETIHGKQIKVSTPKQMLRRLPIEFA